MTSRLFRLNLWKRLANFYRNQAKTYLPLLRNPLFTFPICTNAFIAQHYITQVKKDFRNFDLNLKQACNTGEGAIVELMTVLRSCIIETCQQYRECLKAQIDIIQSASDFGPLTPNWDDLPQFRSLANDLNHELDEYDIVIKTIIQMIDEESIDILVGGKVEHVNVLNEKCKELDLLLANEREENKKSEVILLKLKRDNILKTA